MQEAPWDTSPPNDGDSEYTRSSVKQWLYEILGLLGLGGITYNDERWISETHLVSALSDWAELDPESAVQELELLRIAAKADATIADE